MDRARVFPDFDDAWIVHADEDIVVVNKPETMPTQAADPEMPDDLVTRLKAHLGASYLGVHQRLDRDTSGVLVLARRREANPMLAAQFEGRKVEKRYLACVEGWPASRAKATLKDALLPGDDGRMRVVPAKTRGAQLAVTHVRLVERSGTRALLSLELETGRTHQARVQLAHAGAPIAGDVLYGRTRAPRLLLHAESIAFDRGKRVRYAAPAPADFAEWLARGDLGESIYGDAAALERALRRALGKRYALGRSTGARETTAFRVVNEAGDALPRLALDAYGDHLVAQLYGTEGALGDPKRQAILLDKIHALGFDGVYLKIRPKQANVIVDARRDDLAPRAPVRGTAAPDEFAIVEEGVPYLIRLGDGLSTGIFLDQRANRRRVRELAAGKRVLNLFSYTCAFTVAAAVGGATKTVSVDAAAAALERGQKNLANVGAAGAAHTFVAQDAFAWLAKAKTRGERFDLVLLDPPSYSSTKKRRFSAESDYAELAAAAIEVTAPGGRLLACTNHRGIGKGKFRRVLFDATRLAGRDASQIKDLPDPHDFPTAPGDESHLKSALVTLQK